MTLEAINDNTIIADVKCYHCGHVSGQVIGRRNQPLRATDFVPRPGYTGAAPRPGMRLRCERCAGPVFLEGVTSGLPLARRARRPTHQTAA